MASHSYVANMQAINTQTVQQTQSANNQQTTVVVANPESDRNPTSKSLGSATILGSQSSVPQGATIIQGQQGQQYIVTIADPGSDQGQDMVQLPQGGNQVVYPSHSQQGFTDYNLYTPVSGTTYYQSSGGNSSQMQNLTPVGVHGQIVSGQNTYLIQGGTMDGEGNPLNSLSHTTRASPATVQWLIDNYETAEGVSLPRSTLYYHYLRHCQESKMDPMNPASFGKLIRSVFLGLRTRRLGTRGNSKYHYYGIRIKATSPLNQFSEDQTMAMRQQPLSQGKKMKIAGGGRDGEGLDPGGAGGSEGGPVSNSQHAQFLGDASSALPNFGSIEVDGVVLPDGVTVEHILAFEQLYKEHCEAILDVVVNLQFSLIEALWQTFWRSTTSEQADFTLEARLSKESLFAMCDLEVVQTYVRRSDYAFYQALVEVLIPDVLRPIPSSLTQAIRNFAKSLENWLKNALTGCPDTMLLAKSGAVSAFAQTLRRYTSLNHLAQAARAVLQNTSQITQMLTDLNRVDFANVQEQASWVCQCDDSVVHQIEQDFKKTLQQQNSLEQWAIWLEGVVNQVLSIYEGKPNFAKAARQFLLKWSFYCSMVIRDLTLRSAASFGSFHLIRLLYDEYMFYLVEHKVAAATGETPIAVMGEVKQMNDITSAIAMGNSDMKKTDVDLDDEDLEEEDFQLAQLEAQKKFFSKEAATPNKTTIASSSSTSNGISISQASPGTSLITVNHIPVNALNQGQPIISTASTQQHVITANPAKVSGTGLTVMASAGAAAASNPAGPTKTIVVVPVSDAAAAGDGPPSKRIKSEIQLHC